MKIRVRDLHAILKLLKEDERFHSANNADSNTWLHRELDITQTEENVQTGTLASTLKIRLQYGVQKKLYNGKNHLTTVDTNIEIYDINEKRAAVMKRTTTQEPEE